MKKMKRLLAKGSLFLMLGYVSAIWLVNAQPATAITDWWGTDTTSYNPDVVWSDGFKEDSLLGVVTSAINRILWILSLIALVILLWWGFQMVTAAGDEEKYNKWFTILKQSWIGLAFIAFSWMFVSLVFRLIWKVSWT